MLTPPSHRSRREHTARATAVLVALAAGAAGCAPAPDLEARHAEAAALEAALARAPAPPLPPGAVRVRLAFDARADLDLKVTDPLQETVYFANTPVRSGGALDADRRCGDPAPRIETIAFDRAPPGRYRIGVDYPEACREDAGAVAFALEIEANGTRRLARGTIEPLRFLPVVREFEAGGG